MKKYIGTKVVKAKPMTRQEYNDYQGWELSDNEKHLADEKGMLVEYDDFKHPNHKNHLGYISWSPLDVFEKAYDEISEDVKMTFGLAIEMMKRGQKVARKGWDGKNMFVVYMAPLYLPPFSTQDTNRKVNDRTAKWIGEDSPLDSQGYFAMFTASGQWQPGWLASQSDMLADDWTVL